MKKVLIVDDQRDVLEGTKQFLLSLPQLRDEDILLASNGREGMEIAIRETPDVIVADIMMPELDGLGMIKRLRFAGVSSSVIILSAYSEFDFAKQAIDLGVSDYLVKPVTQRQICSAVMRRLNSAYEVTGHDVFCGMILSGYLSGNNIYARLRDVLEVTGLKLFTGKAWRVAVIEAPEAEDELRVHSFMDGIRRALSDSRISGNVYRTFGRVLIVVMNGASPRLMLDDGDRFIATTSALIGRDARAAMSAPAEGPEALPELYQQAQAALEIAKAKNLRWLDEKTASDAPLLLSEHDAEALAYAIAHTQDSEVWCRLDEIMARLTLSDADTRQKCAVLEAALRKLCERFGSPECMPAFQFEGRQSLFRLKQLATEAIRALLKREMQPQCPPHIQKAVEYIRLHYDSDCSVTYLANYVDLSYSYFSAAFTRTMGVSVTEYVLSVRLDNAARILRERSDASRHRVNVVAARCGFENPRYFSACFKRRFGVLPSEY